VTQYDVVWVRWLRNATERTVIDMVLNNMDRYLVGLAILWLYGILMSVVLRWLPKRLEEWLFGKPKHSPVQRDALVLIIEGLTLNR
jgi:hypothetical protein